MKIEMSFVNDCAKLVALHDAGDISLSASTLQKIEDIVAGYTTNLNSDKLLELKILIFFSTMSLQPSGRAFS